MPALARFARQMALPEIGERGQSRLAGAHVAIAGAGGLGSSLLPYLAGAGVGRITLYDPDIVEPSNLHRQPLFSMDDVGRAKVLVAACRLKGLNPDLVVTPHRTAVDPANAEAFVAGADIVVDAADNFALSYTLSDLCRTRKLPLISASAAGFAGYVGGFCGGAPSLRAVFPDPPQNLTDCATQGVMGPLVGVLGAMQAQMVLQVLLQISPSPLGQLVSVDLKSMQFGGFAFADAGEPAEDFPFLSPSQIAPDDMVYDLRDPLEMPALFVAQATRLPPDRLEQVPHAPGKRTILCCTTGLRAWRAAAALKKLGHNNLALVADGGKG